MESTSLRTCFAPTVNRSAAMILVVVVILGRGATPAAHASTDTWLWQNPLPQGNSVNAVSCTAPNWCKAVGDKGLLFAWDGASWSIESSPTAVSVRGV